MLTVPVPAVLNGDSLREELADAGVPVDVDDMAAVGVELQFSSLVESDRPTVAPVVSAHTGQPTASQQAAATRTADADQAEGNLAGTAGIRAKCKAVLAGSDTFTAAQM